MRSMFMVDQPLLPFSQIARLAIAMAISSGCAAPLVGGFAAREPKSELTVDAAQAQAAADLQAAALRKANGDEEPTQDEALAGILDDLQEVRAIDPEAERQLLADLKEVKPENYPMVVDAFRTALAYRRQLAEREEAAFAGEAAPLNEFEAATQRMTNATNAPSQRKKLAASDAMSGDASLRPAVDASYTADEFPAPRAASVPERPLAEPPLALERANLIEPVALRPGPSAQPLAPLEPHDVKGTVVSDDDLTPAAHHVAATTPLPANPIPTNPLPSASADGDWRAELDATIAELQRTVAPKPTTVAELHDHMRLRALQLLADDEAEAYRPIPGASPAQQDYWSKQLFAMSTYLNTTPQLNDKQRALAALAPLDDARDRLSELATLQIRNLTFVNSVDGFGAYAPSKSATFRPGQKASLYAEIENYASAVDEKGYRTSLGTSYQVLDKTGRRVDGKQFPDVHDECQRRRRDFHMQYELTLPERIYPGPYELELTITDHSSGKIGQATISFEIVGDE